MKYVCLLCIYGLPLIFSFYNFKTLIILIKMYFFSGFISVKGKIVGYNIVETYRDRETNKVGYKYSRVYEYIVDGNNHTGVAYGVCSHSNSTGKIQKIKYNPNDFNDLVVGFDIFKCFSIIILNVLIIIGISIPFKMPFFPDIFIMALLVIFFDLFFSGIKYLLRNSSKKKIGSKLNLSNSADINNNDLENIKLVHYVRYSYKDKVAEKDILNKLLLHDKNFSITLFKQKAVLYFNEIIKAYKSGVFDKVRVFTTDNCFKNDYQVFKDINFDDYEFSSFIYSNISEYNVDNKFEVLGYQLSVKWKKIHGNDEIASTYYMEFIRKYGILTNINDKVISTNCPNCGADTDVTSVGKCKHCGKIITTGDYSWILNKVSYWDQR